MSINNILNGFLILLIKKVTSSCRAHVLDHTYLKCCCTAHVLDHTFLKCCCTAHVFDQRTYGKF